MPPMEIKVFELPPIGTNAILLIAPETQECVLVDAPLNAFATVERWLVQTGYTLKALLLTHGHWDHMLDAYRFNEMGIPVYAHADDRILLDKPDLMASLALPGLTMKPAQVDHWLNPGDALELLGEMIDVRHVPGHCPGSLMFVFPEAKVACCGDAIFRQGVGRCDLPGGDFAQLTTSIREHIYSLPDDFVLYPGHGPHTTVGNEKAENPWVRPA